MITVQIIDDHRMFVEGLVRIIGDSGIARVTGTAHTTRDGLKMLDGGQADVLLLDIHLPDGNGVELCRQITAKYRELRILAVSSFGEYAVVNRMLEAGATGYVLKNSMAEEILFGIESVAAGEKFLCDEVDMMLRRQAGKAVMLTVKERELLRLISEGYISSEIAEKMFLGIETINSYRKNLLLKLGAKNTASLVKIAIEQKLI